MQLPIKAHYATIAVLALASRYDSGELVQARVIAADHAVPSQFLGQILQQLRNAGLIVSVRGSSGGFRLAKSPDSISVADVVEAVCSSTSTENNLPSNDPITRVVGGVWQELNETQLRYLEQLKLSSLVQQMSPEPAAMFFI